MIPDDDRYRELFFDWAGLPLAHSAWRFVPYLVDGEPAALAAVDGTEIHFAVRPDWRGRIVSRRRVREFLAPLFERRGYLTTRIKGRNDAAEDFITRLGFERSRASDGDLSYYTLWALPWQKKEQPTCHRQ